MICGEELVTDKGYTSGPRFYKDWSVNVRTFEGIAPESTIRPWRYAITCKKAKKLARQQYFAFPVARSTIFTTLVLIFIITPLIAGTPRFTHYSRMMGGPFPGHDELALARLSELMRDDADHINRGGRDRGGRLPPSGLVYFGQFIDHDLTRDETTLEDAATPVDERRNMRTPRLDLDSVYGNGPIGSKLLYDNSPPERARFVLGMTKSARDRDTNQTLPSTPDDFPRSNGVPEMGDDRNDENLILAQLHVAFLQFHNRILDCFLKNTIPDPEQYGTTPFERTRRFVTWHYQYLVVNEFLNTMVLDEVWDNRFSSDWRLFKPALDEDVDLPVEFTQAAFRFGHSMAQPEYTLRGNGRNSLLDLIRKQPQGKATPTLRADQVIKWMLFLASGSNRNGVMNFAENIDTLIAEPMYHLPPNSIGVFWGAKKISIQVPLPAITLLRGSRIGLPSGQDACAAYRIQPIECERIGFNEETCLFLGQNDMLNRTPLWYYLLREAEVAGAKSDEWRDRGKGGECLGRLGSRIVTDVIIGVLEADRNSYLNVHNWTPPTFEDAVSRRTLQIERLKDLVMFAKDR